MVFAALPIHGTPSYKPLYKLTQPNTIHPRTLTNMIKTLSKPDIAISHVVSWLTGSRCWLTAWMCLIINRAACATTRGLWWQNLKPQCLPLPFCLPKCHLNEIGPRSLGIRHCIITYLKTLIEHFIKRLALRFCQGGHYREGGVFVCRCMHVCMYLSECAGNNDTKMWVRTCPCVHFKTTADCNLEFKGYLVSSEVSTLFFCLPCTLTIWHMIVQVNPNSRLQIDSQLWVNMYRTVLCSFTQS